MRAELLAAYEKQIHHVAANGAPATARICRAQIALARGSSALGQRIGNWPSDPLKDALPLRVAGGLHHLYLSGNAPELAEVYSQSVTQQSVIDDKVAAIVSRHGGELLTWLDSPPQTNEAGRSANFMAALIWLSPRLGPRFELNEIGSSGGMNLMIDRYHYQLGDVSIGPKNATVRIQPDWQGPMLISMPVEITDIRGCDQNPLDLSDEAVANHLRAYCWPEMPERLERLAKGIELIRQYPPDLVKADAADWTEEQLLRPQAVGTSRVLMHSIVWQYINPDGQDRITAAMAAAGEKATAEKPIAWIALETNIATFEHELRVRYWNGGEMQDQMLGSAHAHGAWLKWSGA